MLSMNDISIDGILYQRYPMLMLERVIKIENGQVCAKPKMDGFYTEKEKVFRPWMILESMGQTAELMWRIKGVKGKGYLARIDNFVNFPLDIRMQDNFYIAAQEKNAFNKLYQSGVEFFYSDGKHASAKITHFFY